MIAPIVMLAAISVAQPAPKTLCLVDAATRAPVVGATVHRATTVGDTSAVTRLRGHCASVPDGVLLVRRVGYHPVHVDLTGQVGVVTMALRALSTAVSLDVVRVEASQGVVSPGHRGGTLSVAEARATGAATSIQLVERLPFTNVRSARGEASVSLRGARREQVVVTLDGLPLNDPATGVADLSDIPLAALSAATVALGADPLGMGPGASGGVLALSTGAPSLVSLRLGSLGQRSVEGAWTQRVGHSVWHAAAMHRAADNDFLFVNGAGATGVSAPERRVNNDETRNAATLGVIGDRWQLAALASRSDRGMVGPANVRANDADRARAERVLLRGHADLRGLQLRGGVRTFSLTYRDPTRPVLDANARVWASDAEARGDLLRRDQRPGSGTALVMGWRAGGGHDDVRASGGISQRRHRAFASTQLQWRAVRTTMDVGARVDAIDGGGVLPSFSVAAERAVTSTWAVSARAAQAVRVPTLYDLYFSSPQRLFVRQLRPERVTADLELGSAWAASLGDTRVALDVSAVSRDTRDAIVWFPGNFGWSPSNVGAERLRGGEARAALTPRWGGVSGWVTWYDAQLTTGTLRIPTPYVPRLAAGTQWTARARGVAASVLTRSMGRRPYTAGPRNHAFELPAVTLMDLTVTHDLPAALSLPRIATTLAWSLENATNTAWQSVRGFPSPGRTWAIAITLRHTPQS